MTRVLVTGAGGFIGSHLAEACLRRGWATAGLFRGPERRGWLAGVEAVEARYGSLEDQASLDRAVRGMDLIIHAAGAVKARSEEEFQRINASGTENLLRVVAAQETPGRFLYISSQAAVGPSPLNQPLNEDAPCRPITPYGRSKQAAEERVLAFKERIPVTVIRPPAVYGPRDREIFFFFQLASRGWVPIPGFGARQVSLVHVDDLVRGVLRAAEQDAARGKVFFLSSGDHAWPELARALSRAVGRGRSLRLPGLFFLCVGLFSQVLGRITHQTPMLDRHKALELTQRAWLCSSARAQQELGFSPQVSLEAGMQATAAWYRNEGWIRS